MRGDQANSAVRRWFFSRMWENRGRLFLLLLAKGIEATYPVLFALSSKRLIDAAAAGQGREMMGAGGFLLIISVAFLLLGVACSALEAGFGTLLNIRLRERLFHALMSRSYTEVMRRRSGELIDCMNTDVRMVCDGIVSLAPNVLNLAIRLLSAGAALFALDTRLPLALLALGAVFFLVSRLFKGYITRTQKASREAMGAGYAFYQEAIQNLLMLRVAHAEKRVEARARALENRYYERWKKLRNLRFITSVAVQGFFDLGYLVTFLFCGYGLLSGTLTFGSVTALTQLVQQVQEPFSDLAGLLPQYYAALASAERLFEIESLPADQQENPADGEALYRRMRALCIRNVTFAHTRDKVLEDASCTIEKGSFTAITGQSGAGKSTLLKLMTGVYPPESGKLFAQTDGEEVPLGRDTRTLFAYVPQGNMLFSGTLRESLTLFYDQVSEEKLRWALDVCLCGFVFDLPQGLDTELGERGYGLSEGQGQRLALARALLGDAQVLLLDEVTSALDEKTEREILKNLRALKDRTVLIVSHRAAVLDICDHEWHIDHAKVYERSIGNEHV